MNSTQKVDVGIHDTLPSFSSFLFILLAETALMPSLFSFISFISNWLSKSLGTPLIHKSVIFKKVNLENFQNIQFIFGSKFWFHQNIENKIQNFSAKIRSWFVYIGFQEKTVHKFHVGTPFFFFKSMKKSTLNLYTKKF